MNISRRLVDEWRLMHLITAIAAWWLKQPSYQPVRCLAALIAASYGETATRTYALCSGLILPQEHDTERALARCSYTT